jgi:hypothetical protein
MRKETDINGSIGIEEIILQYFDGTLSDRGVMGLNARLENDSDLRREFAEMLIHEVQLNEIGKEIKEEGISFSERTHPLFSMPWRIAACAAAAVVVAVMLCFYLMGEGYPSPTAAGFYEVKGANKVERGAVIETRDKEAELSMGNYCRVELKPESSVKIEGKEYAEKIYLERGQVVCDIESKIGTFYVETEAGTVSVKGTKFIVKYLEKGDENMNAKQMFVKVLVGAVLLSGAWGSMPLAAGDEAVVPEEKKVSLPESLYGFSGMVRGVVVEKGNNNFTFKVGKLLKVWKENKAGDPKAIVGRTVRVGPRWVKDERGKWRKVGTHVAFIRSLEAGQEMTLEIKHAERDMFAILELSEEQRKNIKHHREGDADRKPGEGDRGGKHDEEGRDIRHEEGKKEGGRHETDKRRKNIENEIEELMKRVEKLKAELEALKKGKGEEDFKRDNREKPGIKHDEGEAEKTIVIGEPHYKYRNHGEWRTKGRVVGRVENAPKFTIKVINTRGKVIKTVTVEKGAKAYEIEWLTPGIYKLLITSEGYKPLIVKVNVKARNDLFLNIIFKGSKDREGDRDREGEKQEEGKKDNNEEEVIVF